MKALSVKQPYAYLICSGIKDIENRTWKLPEKMKGQRVLIHASMDTELNFEALSKDQYADVCAKFKYDRTTLKAVDRWDRGAIIGSVELVYCVINHPSIWAEKSEIGQLDEPANEFGKPIYNWILANPVLFDEPIPCKGKLGFWEYNNKD